MAIFGFSDKGGLFIAKGIDSVMHQHLSIALVLSFTETFQITTNDETQFYKAALIPREKIYRLQTSANDFTAFFHLDPFSDKGLPISTSTYAIRSFSRKEFSTILEKMSPYLSGESGRINIAHKLIDCVIESIIKVEGNRRKLDDRITKSLVLLKQTLLEDINLNYIAGQVALSPSRFSHLFKDETGISFKKYLAHCKLIRSLQQMFTHQDLTEAAFFGGFADQSHFHKTFKSHFGIIPSSIKHSK